MSKIEVIEGLLEQTTSERKVFSVDFAGCGVSTLASATAAAYDEVDEDDVSATVFPTNSPTTSGAVATLSPFRSLTKDHTYRIEVLGVEGTSYHEAYVRVACVK